MMEIISKLGSIHRPCGHERGSGGQPNALFSKMVHKDGRGQIHPKNRPHGLWMAPYHIFCTLNECKIKSTNGNFKTDLTHCACAYHLFSKSS